MPEGKKGNKTKTKLQNGFCAQLGLLITMGKISTDQA